MKLFDIKVQIYIKICSFCLHRTPEWEIIDLIFYSNGGAKHKSFFVGSSITKAPRFKVKIQSSIIWVTKLALNRYIVNTEKLPTNLTSHI